MFKEKHLTIAGRANMATMCFLKERITEIEKAVLKKAKLWEEYHKLLTVPGIGKILALTIMFETRDITRFPEVDNYVSYCHCVGSINISNGKNKGEGNRKNGNKYLSWAYAEAANFAIRGYPYARSYYQKKAVKTSNIVGIKAVSHKLARASYCVIKNREVFDYKKSFCIKDGCGR